MRWGGEGGLLVGEAACCVVCVEAMVATGEGFEVLDWDGWWWSVLIADMSSNPFFLDFSSFLTTCHRYGIH